MSDVTNGHIDSAHYGPIGDAARHIASYCEGNARVHVYTAAFDALTTTQSELATSAARIASLEAENATLRHWAWGHLDALLLYAAGSYPKDSNVKDAVAFCRIIAPNRKLRMDPLEASDFHPARQALTGQPA